VPSTSGIDGGACGHSPEYSGVDPGLHPEPDHGLPGVRTAAGTFPAKEIRGSKSQACPDDRAIPRPAGRAQQRQNGASSHGAPSPQEYTFSFELYRVALRQVIFSRNLR